MEQCMSCGTVFVSAPGNIPSGQPSFCPGCGKTVPAVKAKITINWKGVIQVIVKILEFIVTLF